MIIRADENGDIEIEIKTRDGRYGFNCQRKRTKRTVKIKSLTPHEDMKLSITKGKEI